MTTLNTALNYSFASAEAQRIAAAERGAEEVIANQLRQNAAREPFAVGSTITARYQYKVGQDGSLIPLSTQITTEAPIDAKVTGLTARRQRYKPEDELDERRPSFGDLARPKATLNPSDEVTLFASLVDDQAEITAKPTSPIAAEVFDDLGAPVAAELIAPQAKDNAPRTNVNANFAVASLYARNNDIVYTVTPIAQFAA